MPMLHPDQEVVAGDDWIINGTINDITGAPINTGPIEIRWVLIDPTGSYCTATDSVSIVKVTPTTSGQITITVPHDATAPLVPGRYRDGCRVVVNDIVGNAIAGMEWAGNILVDANPFLVDNMPMPGVPSMLSAYGEITAVASSTPTNLNIQGAWYPIQATWSFDNPAVGTTYNLDAGQIICTTPGQYLEITTIAYMCTTTTQALTFGIFKNNGLTPEHIAETWTDTPSFTNSVTITGLDPLQTGDVLDLRVMCETTSSVVITVTDINFSVAKVG